MENLQLSELAPQLFVDPVAGVDELRNSPLFFEKMGTQPFKTLSYALKQASPGTIIYLQPGCYDATHGEAFPLVIPPGVAVVGDVPTRGEKTAIVGGGDWDSPIFGRQNTAIVVSNQAQMRGLTVTNPNSKGTGIWIEAATATIAHCQLSGCGREGVFVTGEAVPVILNCWFLQNRASGITFTRYAKGEIQHSILGQNRFGITLGDFAAPFISQSEIAENQVGMVLSGASRPILRSNHITANVGEGIVLFSQAALDLGDRQSPGGNFFQGNGDLAIRNVGSQPIVAAGNWLHPLSVGGTMQSSAPFGGVEFRALQPVQTGGGEADTLTNRPLPATEGASIDLSDATIPPDLAYHWSLPFVPAILTRRIMGCFADGTFQPDRPISRAQFAAAVVRAFQSFDPSASEPGEGEAASDADRASDLSKQKQNFRDVPADHWASDSIAQAVRMKFVEPEADLLFCPEQPLPRWQAIVALVRGLELKGDRSNLLRSFRDRAEIPTVAAAAVAAAVTHRLLVLPQSDRLTPQLPITRAELAAWIYQALVLRGEAEARLSSAIVQPSATPDFSQALTVPTQSAAEVPRLATAGDRLRVAIGLDSLPNQSESAEVAASVEASVGVAAQVAERLKKANVIAHLIQGGDRPLDPEELAVLQQFQPDLVLQIRLVAVSSEAGTMGIQTQYSSPESQPFAAALHHKLLASLDLPDRGVIPLPEPSFALDMPLLKVEVSAIAEMINDLEETDRSFYSYVAEAIEQGLLQFAAA